MKRFHGLLLAVVIILSSTLGAIMFVALWPYLDIVGKVAVGFLMVCFGCAGFLAVVATWHWVGIIAARRRREDLHSHLIAVDGVVVLTKSDGSFLHLSAEHEAAKRPLQIAAPVTIKEMSEQESDADDLKILSMAEQGVSGRQIEKQLGLSHHKVTTTINAWKEKHNMA